MSTTDTSEKGIETLIIRHMTGTDGLASVVAETPDALAAAKTASSGWLADETWDVVQFIQFQIQSPYLASF
jgi:hypothetical protein